MSSEDIPEPVEARPWRRENGPPEPVVWLWPEGDRPTLLVWSAGEWRNAPVMAEQDWPDGSVYFQVSVDLRGDSQATVRLYRWPQSGLRAGQKSGSQPSRSVDVRRQGNMPHRGPRRA
ncbi:hypothetical protein OHT59_40530 [Streptomyces sp. NBC_00243]|uniref:hypothetical protein n=1 Tax=Streptomyces sp. NBC_00243 TaxID=2975688 RepID=UPI002DD7CBAD|nr:hypothetical protein [Streptomyces sp. NBC_00243]WRZ24360.1 hypothetical protein OHT59_40530 [Streptomyces sp. NBC_00243]